MRIASCFVFLALVAALVAACSESSSMPAAPSSTTGSGALTLSADQLTGTWTLVSIQPAGQAEQTKPAGATYTVMFGDGRLSTRVDCNMCGGSFALSGETLTAGPALACTRAACPTMAFENTYTGI